MAVWLAPEVMADQNLLKKFLITISLRLRKANDLLIRDDCTAQFRELIEVRSTQSPPGIALARFVIYIPNIRQATIVQGNCCLFGEAALSRS